jgi:hypothetical protein
MAYGDYFPDFTSNDPYGDGTGGYDQGPLPPDPSQRPPAPKRLTYDELLALMQESAAPPKPVPVTNVRGLTGDDRTQAQRAGLWAGLSALGNSVSGHPDPEAVAHIQGAQQGVVDRYNAQQQTVYQNSVDANAAEVAQEAQKQKAGALFGSYQKIAAAEPPDSPFAADAEAAAKLGDMSKLQTMLDQVPQRAAARQGGLDPDAWSTNQRLQSQLQDLLKHQSAVSALPDEVAKAQGVGAATNAQEQAREMAVKAAPAWQAPQQPLQLPPLSYVQKKAEIEASIKDAHQKSIELRPRLQMSNGQWGLVKPNPIDPGGAPSFTPATGQPVKVGKYHFTTIGDVQYAEDTEHPEAGAFPVKLNDANAVAPWAAPSFGDVQGGASAGPLPPRVPPFVPPIGAAGPPPALRPVGAPLPKPVAPAVAQQATRSLSTIKDPVVSAKIEKARASGYSDSEIAAFLGIH